MSETMKNKVAIITGSSRGIGRATAELLGEKGASVVINYAGNKSKADEAVVYIEKVGGKAIAVQGDMSKVQDIKNLFAEAKNKFGKIDIVINCPGTFVMKPIVEITEEEFDKVFNLNSRGTFFVLQQAAKHISDGGSIINLSSGATVASGPGSGVYAASKAAAEQMITVLAKELAPRKITVNTVSPGPTETDGLVLPPQIIEKMIQMTPLGRLGQPRDVANVIAFLVSDEGHWVTAQNYRANGGIV